MNIFWEVFISLISYSKRDNLKEIEGEGKKERTESLKSFRFLEILKKNSDIGSIVVQMLWDKHDLVFPRLYNRKDA